MATIQVKISPQHGTYIVNVPLFTVNYSTFKFNKENNSVAIKIKVAISL